MRSPRATSTEAPTTRSRAITPCTIASSCAALRSATELVWALAAEQRSNRASVRRAIVRMAEDYSRKETGRMTPPRKLEEAMLVYGEEAMVNKIVVNESAQNGLGVVNTVRQSLEGSRKADGNGIQRPLGAIGRSFAGFHVEGHIASVPGHRLAHNVAPAVDARDFGVSTVNAGKEIKIAARLEDSVKEVLVEEPPDDDAGVRNASKSLVFSQTRCSEIECGELARLPLEIAAHNHQRVVHCTGTADEWRRRIDDLQLSGVMEQKAVEDVEGSFKGAHQVSAIVQTQDEGAARVGNVDRGKVSV